MHTLEIGFEDGAIPEPHEISTALFLSKLGKEITFLAPKNQPGIKTPDITMDGKKWEIKAPVSAGSRSIEHAFRAAMKQSPNIIFDLRSSKASDQTNLARLKYTFRLVKGKKVGRLLVITKDQQLIDISTTI
jgi:hypothetical protein